MLVLVIPSKDSESQTIHSHCSQSSWNAIDQTGKNPFSIDGNRLTSLNEICFVVFVSCHGIAPSSLAFSLCLCLMPANVISARGLQYLHHTNPPPQPPVCLWPRDVCHRLVVIVMALLLTRPRSTHKHKAVQAKGSATSSFGTLSLSLWLMMAMGFIYFAVYFCFPPCPICEGSRPRQWHHAPTRGHPASSGEPSNLPVCFRGVLIV